MDFGKSLGTLLTLDTAAEDGAGEFYEKLGFIRAGIIPDYAPSTTAGRAARSSTGSGSARLEPGLSCKHAADHDGGRVHRRAVRTGAAQTARAAGHHPRGST